LTAEGRASGLFLWRVPISAHASDSLAGTVMEAAIPMSEMEL
jgi:hypothetical protein